MLQQIGFWRAQAKVSDCNALLMKEWSLNHNGSNTTTLNTPELNPKQIPKTYAQEYGLHYHHLGALKKLLQLPPPDAV